MIPSKSRPSTENADTGIKQAMQALLESLPDSAFIMDLDGTLLNINTLFAGRFGMQPEACIGRSMFELISEVADVRLLTIHLREKCDAVIQTGISQVFEDDTDIWKVYINPIRSSSGDISSLFIILKDISGQKQRERQMQKEREINTILLDAIPCSAIILDSNRELIASNQYARKLMFASDKEERTAIGMHDFFRSDDIMPLKKTFLNTLHSGNESSIEVEIHPQGGQETSWMLTRSKRILIDGKPCLVSIGLDISERKKIEQDLFRYQEKLSMALQASNTGIWEWDLATGAVDWTDEAWRLYGLDKTAGTPSVELWKTIVHTDDLDQTIRAVSTAADKMEDIEFEFRVCHPDGSIRWLMSRGKPARNQHENRTSYIGTVIDITESKELELELQTKKTLIDQTLGASRIGVWERDLETKSVFWSDTLWKLYGIEKGNQSLSYNRWLEIVHPDDHDRMIQDVHAATSNGVGLNIEYRVCHPDGSIHWLMSRGTPLPCEHGAMRRYVGSVIDITERRQMENELVESKLLFGYALDAAHTGIWEWNVVTDELKWSEQVWKLYGLLPKSTPLNRRLSVKTIHPEDREMVSRIIRDAVRDSNSVSVEYRTCHPDGSIHWLTSRGMPMYDENGRLTRYIGAIIDITERKKVEIALIENKKRLGQALEAAQAGVWEWDPTTHENVWSDEIWPLYGLEHKKGVSPSFELWVSTIHPEDIEETMNAVNEAANSQTDLYAEYRLYPKDNSVRWLMSRGKPVLDEQGRTIRYIGTIIDITERKLAELALQESKLRFNFALEATKSGIWEWDMKSDKVIWSDQIWKLYGLKPFSDTPSPRLWESNIYPDDREKIFSEIMSAASNDSEFTVEHRVCHPDGSIHWLMCHGVPRSGNNEHSRCFLGTVMDITERKRADEKFLKSQAKLNFVLSKSDLGVWDLNLSDHTAERSREHAKIFGYHDNSDTWSLERFLNHIVPDDRQRVEQYLQRSFEKEESYTFECRIRTASGQIRWIWIFGAFDVNHHDKARHLYGIVQDITERKHTELLLKENEQKFRNIFAFSPIAIGIEDPDTGTLYDVNASWLLLFNCWKEEVIGQKVQDIGIYAHPEDHEQIASALREQEKIFNRPFELRNKRGNVVIVLLSAEFITMNNKICMMVMMTDITVQELQQANISQLEKVVTNRTEQLRQEVERLQRFLSMITHEYRTPLAIIRGNLDLIELKHKSGNQDNEREMAKIKRAIGRLVEVMEVSIQESRLLESPKPMHAEAFEIEPVITSQIEAVLSMWPELTIRSTGNLDEAMIFGEATKLKMAIFNLLDNARKYSLSGTAIEIERCQADQNAIITIRNQGKSITNLEGEELFEKYRRGSNAANTSGAGIGLWLVKNIVEQHLGWVILKGTATGVESVVTIPLVRNHHLTNVRI